MAFNTTSYLSGVGSVVVVLSTGFAGGYFFASPDQTVPPTRLQRVAADATDAKATAATAPQAKPEIVAAAPFAVPVQAGQAQAKPIQAEPVPASTTQSPDSQTSAPPVQQAAEQPAPQVAAKTPAPAPAAPERTVAQANLEKANVETRSPEAEAKAASRKRAEARKLAEQQRRQRELEVAAGAVRHIIHDRDGGEIMVHNGDAPDQEVVQIDQEEPSGPDVKPFGFFGR